MEKENDMDLVICVYKKFSSANKITLKIFCTRTLSQKSCDLIKRFNELLLKRLPLNEVKRIIELKSPSVYFARQGKHFSLHSAYATIITGDRNLLNASSKLLQSLTDDFSNIYDCVLYKEVSLNYDR